MTAPIPSRNRQLAAIHIAAQSAGLDDAAYRALLREVAGVDSAAALDAEGRRAVLARLGRGRGVVVGWRGARIAKARKLWHLLAEAGVLNKPTEAAFRHFCAKQTGVARLEWADSAALNRVIESLKSWCARERVALD